MPSNLDIALNGRRALSVRMALNAGISASPTKLAAIPIRATLKHIETLKRTHQRVICQFGEHLPSQ